MLELWQLLGPLQHVLSHRKQVLKLRTLIDRMHRHAPPLPRRLLHGSAAWRYLEGALPAPREQGGASATTGTADLEDCLLVLGHRQPPSLLIHGSSAADAAERAEPAAVAAAAPPADAPVQPPAAAGAAGGTDTAGGAVDGGPEPMAVDGEGAGAGGAGAAAAGGSPGREGVRGQEEEEEEEEGGGGVVSAEHASLHRGLHFLMASATDLTGNIKQSLVEQAGHNKVRQPAASSPSLLHQAPARSQGGGRRHACIHPFGCAVRMLSPRSRAGGAGGVAAAE